MLYVLHKELINGQPQSGENCSFSDATLSPEPSFKEDQLPAVTSKTLFAYQRTESLPFVVTLKQHRNGIGLILGKSSASGLVYIKDILSTGSAAQDGTLKWVSFVCVYVGMKTLFWGLFWDQNSESLVKVLAYLTEDEVTIG